MFRTLTFAALIAYASAQSLSTQCTGALAAIAANPDANACLTPDALISLVSSSNNSIIGPVNTWLSSLCSAPSCSNATLAAIVQNATTGCSTEFGSIGFTSSLTPTIISVVQQYYPTVRKVACLKDGDTNCITQTLTNLQTALGVPLSVNNLIGVFTNPPEDKIQAIVANKTLTCTNCIKAAYNVINQDIPSLISDAAPALQSQCGASFTDNSTPAGISQSASTSTSGSNAAQSSGSGNNAAATLSTGAFTSIGVSALIAVGSAFALLA